jgi:tetratricopeptide (TPR) repeat protein
MMTPRSRIAIVPGLIAVLAAGLGGCSSDQPTSEVADAPFPPPPRPVIDLRRPNAEQAMRADAAKAMIGEGRHEDAIRTFESLLDENPSLTIAYVGIGQAYEDLGQFRRAEPAYARATRLDPRDFDAQYGHGTVLRALGRLKEAARAYQQALSIRPEDLGSLTGLGATFIELEMPASAIVPIQRRIELDPDDGDARAMLGTAYMLAGRLGDAIDAYEVAIEYVGNDPELIGNLVECYAREDRHREAANAGQVLVAIAPSPQAWERLGRAYFRLGDYDASVESYKRAVELDPEFWPALNGVGVNELNRWLRSERTDLDARDAAADAFRASLRANPDQRKVVSLLTTYGL